MPRRPGRPPGRAWFASRAGLLVLLATAARALALDPAEPAVTLANVARAMGKGLRTVQEAMAEQEPPIEWLPIRRDALRLRFPRFFRTFAA